MKLAIALQPASTVHKLKGLRLLEIAKTGVERVILLQRGYANETDEATATTWINQQLQHLDIELTH